MYIIVSTYIYFECYWSGDLCIPLWESREKSLPILEDSGSVQVLSFIRCLCLPRQVDIGKT